MKTSSVTAFSRATFPRGEGWGGISMKKGEKAMSIIQCDKCGKKMSAMGMKIQFGKIGEIFYNYFTCTGCGEIYIGTAKDAELQIKIDQLGQEKNLVKTMIRKNMRKKSIRRKEKEIEKLRKEILTRQRELKIQVRAELEAEHAEKNDGECDPVGFFGEKSVQGQDGNTEDRAGASDAAVSGDFPQDSQEGKMVRNRGNFTLLGAENAGADGRGTDPD